MTRWNVSNAYPVKPGNAVEELIELKAHEAILARNGNVTAAALSMGISRFTLMRILDRSERRRGPMTMEFC